MLREEYIFKIPHCQRVLYTQLFHDLCVKNNIKGMVAPLKGRLDPIVWEAV